jgi:hypothetical protein
MEYVELTFEGTVESNLFHNFIYSLDEDVFSDDLIYSDVGSILQDFEQLLDSIFVWELIDLI